MYAIVNIAGQQYKVEKDQKLLVHRLEGKEGQTVQFDEVLLIDNDKNVLVGEPTLKGARITGKVLSHPKGEKVQVFKKKKRKGYRVYRGHRQYLTEIQIQEIIEKGASKESGPGAETAQKTKTEVKPEAKPKAKKEPTAKKGDGGSGSTSTAKSATKVTTRKESSGTKAAAKPVAKKSTGTVQKKPSAGKKEKE